MAYGANPSLLGGTDYAFGGARTGPLTPTPLPGGLLSPFPPSLETQVAFLFLRLFCIDAKIALAELVPKNILDVWRAF